MKQYTREERPWITAQKIEFLTADGKNMFSPCNTEIWLLLQNWVEKREVIYGHEFLRNQITRTVPLIGFGDRQAIVCKSLEDANKMMIYLSDLFCYAPPELITTYDARAHQECYP